MSDDMDSVHTADGTSSVETRNKKGQNRPYVWAEDSLIWQVNLKHTGIYKIHELCKLESQLNRTVESLENRCVYLNTIRQSAELASSAGISLSNRSTRALWKKYVAMVDCDTDVEQQISMKYTRRLSDEMKLDKDSTYRVLHRIHALKHFLTISGVHEDHVPLKSERYSRFQDGRVADQIVTPLSASASGRPRAPSDSSSINTAGTFTLKEDSVIWKELHTNAFDTVILNVTTQFNRVKGDVTSRISILEAVARGAIAALESSLTVTCGHVGNMWEYYIMTEPYSYSLYTTAVSAVSVTRVAHEFRTQCEYVQSCLESARVVKWYQLFSSTALSEYSKFELIRRPFVQKPMQPLPLPLPVPPAQPIPLPPPPPTTSPPAATASYTFSLEAEAAMCCVALRFRHSPHVLLPHNLSLLYNTMPCTYAQFREHLNYLSALMLGHRDVSHSAGRSFTAAEDRAIRSLASDSSPVDLGTLTPLPLFVLHRANGYRRPPSKHVVHTLAQQLQCTDEAVWKRCAQLRTLAVLEEVGRQEEAKASEVSEVCIGCAPPSTGLPYSVEAFTARQARRLISVTCDTHIFDSSNTNNNNANNTTATTNVTENSTTQQFQMELEALFEQAVY